MPWTKSLPRAARGRGTAKRWKGCLWERRLFFDGVQVEAFERWRKGNLMRDYKSRSKQYAKEMRHSMTPEERRLWYDFLSKHSCHFRRQQPIGKYIVDFYAVSLRLAVEVDGSQHFEEDVRLYDDARTKFLREHDIRLLRFTNEQIQRKFSDVCAAVERAIADIQLGDDVCGAEEDGHVY